jgi:hypothetical protein
LYVFFLLKNPWSKKNGPVFQLFLKYIIKQMQVLGYNCRRDTHLSQKVPKFELYKHNDELFNIYHGFFYELWTFAYFDRLCKLKKRGDEIKKNSSPLNLLSQSQPNFAEMILGCSSFKIVFVSTVLYLRWPPLLKIEISSNGQKLFYFKPESAQIWTV